MVVVELHHDEIQRHRLQDIIHGNIREGTLRCGCEVVTPTRRCGGRVNQLPQPRSKRRHILGRRLEVKIEAIDNSVAEGSVYRRALLPGSEHSPHPVGPCHCLLGTREAALSVRGTTKRQQHCFASRLTRRNVILNLRAPLKPRSRKRGTPLTGGSKVDKSRGLDTIEKGDRDQVNRGA